MELCNRKLCRHWVFSFWKLFVSSLQQYLDQKPILQQGIMWLIPLDQVVYLHYVFVTHQIMFATIACICRETPFPHPPHQLNYFWFYNKNIQQV